MFKPRLRAFLGCLAVVAVWPAATFHIPSGVTPRLGLRKTDNLSVLFATKSWARQRPREKKGAAVENSLKSPGTSVGDNIGAGVDSAVSGAPISQEWAYDWKKQFGIPIPLMPSVWTFLILTLNWYGVGYAHDFPAGSKPSVVSVFDEPLVIFRDGDGVLRCVQDLCPHRASKLSEGMVNDGKIECLYHGWQFEGKTGTCVHIPQLGEGSFPPVSAGLRVYPLEVRENVVFVWMGDDPWGQGAADIKPVPCTQDDLDVNKFVYEMPYDWSYLTENLLDPAHICISHDATVGGGKRADAGPLDFKMGSSTGPWGFEAGVTNKNGVLSEFRFDAPCIVRVRTVVKKKAGAGGGATAGGEEGEQEKEGPVFGAALHCLPLGKGRSRLLFMTYAVGAPFIVKCILAMKPKWTRHLNSCKVLEQDMGLICTQEDHVARTGESLSKAFLPIKTSDTLVVELRKWLDKVGHGMPFYQGWQTSKSSISVSDCEHPRRDDHRTRESRFNRHVVISEETKRALRRVIVAKKVGFGAAVALALVALVAPVAPVAASAAASSLGASATTSSSAVMAAVMAVRAGVHSALGATWATLGRSRTACAVGATVALAAGVGAKTLEGHFYNNFERHPSVG